MTTKWIGTAEAARRLGLSQGWVRTLIVTGVIPGGVKAGTAPGSPYRVTERAVADYARTRTP